MQKHVQRFCQIMIEKDRLWNLRESEQKGFPVTSAGKEPWALEKVLLQERDTACSQGGGRTEKKKKTFSKKTERGHALSRGGGGGKGEAIYGKLLGVPVVALESRRWWGRNRSFAILKATTTRRMRKESPRKVSPPTF